MGEKVLQKDKNKAGADDMSAAAIEEQEDEKEADDVEATQIAEDIESLREQLEAEKEAAAEYSGKAMRAQAEMENMRKRVARDIESAHKYALERFVKELLPVVDSLELGMSASKVANSTDELYEGMALTLKNFTDVITKFGVDVIDPAGEKFNPDLHDAVSTQEAEGKDAGLVNKVMQKGYRLNGRLIRPAMVIVTK